MRNIIKTSCHSRLFFVLHLLVNRVIKMTTARKVVERVFIQIQFFPYLRKQRWLFSLGALRRIHPWVRSIWLFDFCTPWNCQKIIDFPMVLGEGWSLTGLLELVLYGSVALGVFHWCYIGIPLVFWGISTGVLGNVQLFCHCSGVFRCSVGVPCLFVPCSSVPGFIVSC